MNTKIAQSRFVDTTEGVIWKQLLQFFVPVFLSNIFQQIYNMVDVWFVGNYVGFRAIAAIGGSTSLIINIIIAMFNGFASTITVLIAQKFGAKNKIGVKKMIYNSLVLCSFIGMLLGIMGIIITPIILKCSSIPMEIMDMAVLYLRIYFFGTIAIFLYNISAGMLRALGDSKRPLYCLYFCCAINFFLDYLLIVIFRLGVAGAAVATIIAQYISAAINLFFLLNRKSEFYLVKKEISLETELIKKILLLGIPAAMQNMMYSFAKLIMQSVINKFGTDTIAAVSLYDKIDVLCWWAMTAYGYAMTTFVGQNYGAGKKNRIIKGLKICLIMAMLTEALLSGLFVLLSENYFQLFTDNTDVVQIGIQIVRRVTPFYITYIFIEPLVGAIKGTGDTTTPMIITFFGICVLRVTWVLLMNSRQAGFFTIMMNYPVTWITTSATFIIYCCRKTWLMKDKKKDFVE